MIEWNDDHALRPVLRYLGRAELEREPYVRGGTETPLEPVFRTERFRFSPPTRGEMRIESLAGPQKEFLIYVCSLVRRGQYSLRPDSGPILWKEGASEMYVRLPLRADSWLIACVRDRSVLDFCFAKRDDADRAPDSFVRLQMGGAGRPLLIVEPPVTPDSSGQSRIMPDAQLGRYRAGAEDLAKIGALGMTVDEVSTYWTTHSIGISRLVMLVYCGLRVQSVTRGHLQTMQGTRLDSFVKEQWPRYEGFIKGVERPSDEERVWAFLWFGGLQENTVLSLPTPPSPPPP